MKRLQSPIAALMKLMLVTLLANLLPLTGALATEESVDVRLLHVDVLVLDKKGEPVRDLEEGAFRVKVDGKAVKLAAFEGYEKGREQVEADALSWIVVIDDHFLRPASRARALDAIESFFVEGGLRPGDGVLIARIQATGKILAARSSDPELIGEALDELRGMAPRLGGASDPGRQIVEDLGRELRGFQAGGGALSMATPQIDLYAQSIRAYAMEERRYALSSLEAIANLLAMSADLPGRRLLVHVSDGLPIRPGEELFTSVARTLEQALQRGISLGESAEARGGGGSAAQTRPDFSALAAEGRRFEITSELAQVAARANAERIALYGLHAGGQGDAGAGALGSSPLGAAFERALDNNLRGSLEFLAGETSARASYGRKDITGFLEQAQDEGRSRYVLAVEPPGEPDGAIHQVSVKVKGYRKRDQVRYRRSFLRSERPLSPEEALVRKLVAGPVASREGWAIETGERSPHESGRDLVTLRALIPLSEMLNAGATSAGKIDVLVALLGAKGSVTIPGRAELPVELPEGASGAEAGDALYPVEVSILVESGRARAALALVLSEGEAPGYLVTEIEP